MVEQNQGVVAVSTTVVASAPVPAEPSRWQRFKDWWAQSTARRVATGAKSLAVAGVGAALGLADYVDQIDIAGLLGGIFGDNVKVGAVITVCFMVMAIMRLVSKGAAFAGLKGPNDGE